MPLYECTFISRQDLSRADVTRLTEQFGQVLAEKGGKIVKNEYWGLRPLAYDINKNRRGHYNLLGIDASADALKEMERVMGLNEEVVRSLTVRVEAIEEAPSALLRAERTEVDAA